MDIKDRLVRQSEEDVIAIGDIVERSYNAAIGAILRAFINGKITETLTINQDNPSDREPLSAERLLGRCEGYQNVISGLEMMIEDKNRLLKEEKPNEEEEELDYDVT